MTRLEALLRAVLAVEADTVHPSPDAITCIRARTSATPDREAWSR